MWNKRKGRKDRTTVDQPIQSLARIAVKHKIDAKEFLHTILEAWKNKRSKCGKLTIKRRRKTEDSATFLFVTKKGVVAQFPIPTDILTETYALKKIEKVALAIKRKKSTRLQHKTGELKIEKIRAGMKHVKVKARVVKKPEARMVATRFGTRALVSNILVADETDKIRLSLWNKQIKSVSVGDVIEVENGKVASYKGERQLRTGRNGEVNVVEDEKFPEINKLR
jgi:hypothetical protein